MRNKKNKSAVNEFNDNRSGRVFYRRWELLLINPLVDSNILRGEQDLWDNGDQRYPVMEKMTLSRRHKLK